MMSNIKASVLLLTYNQEAFVGEALQSLLEQDYENLEIVISDDCSSDNTWEIIQHKIQRNSGSKKIITNRNHANLGVVGNFFKAFGLSTGELIFTAAGDDVSLPNRCSACIEFWAGCEFKPSLIAADAYDMSESGAVLGVKKTDNLKQWDLSRWLQQRPYMFGASHMMTKGLLALRNLDPRLCVEDQNLIARALMMDGCLTFNTPLVKHRRGGLSQRKAKLNYEEKKRNLERSAHQSVIEQEELLKDARLIGFDVDFRSNKNHELSKYILAVFGEKGFKNKLKTFLEYAHVPLMRRFRFFQFSAFPKANALAIKLKNQLKSV